MFTQAIASNLELCLGLCANTSLNDKYHNIGLFCDIVVIRCLVVVLNKILEGAHRQAYVQLLRVVLGIEVIGKNLKNSTSLNKILSSSDKYVYVLHILGFM